MPVPAILLAPPWETHRPKPKPAVWPITPPTIPDAIVWGERGNPPVPWGIPSQRSPELDARLLAKVGRTAISYVDLFDATDDAMLGILAKWPDRVRGHAEGLTYLLSRLGDPALPFVRRAFEAAPFDAPSRLRRSTRFLMCSR